MYHLLFCWFYISRKTPQTKECHIKMYILCFPYCYIELSTKEDHKSKDSAQVFSPRKAAQKLHKQN